MTNTQSRMTLKSVQSIMQKRSTIPADAVGSRVKLFIQGNGNVVMVKDKQGNPVPSTLPGQEGTILEKRIYNVRANSGIAMKNARNIEILREAVAAEKAGDMEKAGALYNDFLNKTQISFGVILPNPKVEFLTDGVQIAATIEEVKTENGSLLTIDASTFSIVEAKSYGSVAFDVEALLGVTAEEPAAADAVPGAEATAADVLGAPAADAAELKA